MNSSRRVSIANAGDGNGSRYVREMQTLEFDKCGGKVYHLYKVLIGIPPPRLINLR